MEPSTWGVTVFALFVEFGSILGTFVSLGFYTPSLLAKQGELFFSQSTLWRGREGLRI